METYAYQISRNSGRTWQQVATGLEASDTAKISNANIAQIHTYDGAYRWRFIREDVPVLAARGR